MLSLRLAAPALVLALLIGAAAAQGNRVFPPMQPPGAIQGQPPSYPTFPTNNPRAYPNVTQQQPAQQGRSQACMRLEGQLAALDSGAYDPARNEQVRRYEDAASRQQGELDRTVAQSRRLSCEGGGLLSIFTAQNPQCGPLTNQIQQMRGNLDRILFDLERIRGGGADREGQRRGLMLALAQNDCGPQYRTAAARGTGFFDALLGPGTIMTPEAQAPPTASGTFRTLCVRTCDGFYFPISFATVPARFGDDERICQRMCPAAEVTLYSHRNPGEDVNQAVSIGGQPYTSLPTAFRYRQSFDKACSCRRAGESWAEALKAVDDRTLESGDIVVTEERAKQLSQPQQPRPAKADPRAKGAAPVAEPEPAATPAPTPAAANAPAKNEGERKIRSVGPTFIPTR